MKIKTYHSSSMGNLYQIDDLIIDAGMPINVIRASMRFDLSSIRACLCSHAHMDHSRGIKSLMERSGIDCYMSQASADKLGLNGHRTHIIESKKKIKIGSWDIMPFDLVHDEPNLGFILAKDGEKLVYANDTHYIPYKFKDITHLMIGVNHDIEIIRKKIESGWLEPVVAHRTINNHMSISTFLRFLKANDLGKLREIHMLHLSNGTSNAEEFKRKVMGITGVPTYIAEA